MLFDRACPSLSLISTLNYFRDYLSCSLFLFFRKKIVVADVIVEADVTVVADVIVAADIIVAAVIVVVVVVVVVNVVVPITYHELRGR